MEFFFFWLYIWKIRRLLYLNLFGGTLSPTGQTWRAHFRFLVSKTRLKQFLPDGLLCKLSVLLTSPDTNLAHNELFSEIDTGRTFRNRKPRIKRPKSGYVQLCVHMWRSHQWCLVTAENRTDQVWNPPVLHLKHGQTCLATATLSIHNHQKMMVSVYKGHSRRTRACPQREQAGTDWTANMFLSCCCCCTSSSESLCCLGKVPGSRWESCERSLSCWSDQPGKADMRASEKVSCFCAPADMNFLCALK